MGETRVDLLHLLEDLRDAYPGSLEETILTEIMANALDSGASVISVDADPAAKHHDGDRQRLGYATTRSGAFSRYRREHQDPRSRHRFCRRRHQARPVDLRGSADGNAARQKSRGIFLAHGVAPSRALEMDCRRPASSPSAAPRCA